MRLLRFGWRWGLLGRGSGLSFCSEAGSRPGGRLTFFASPKKVSKERRPLLSASLRFATGNLRCSTPAGVRRTRFAQTAAALIPPPSALLGAYRRGWERAAFALARPQVQQPALNLKERLPTAAARSAAAAWWPREAKARMGCTPLCMRRGAEGFADQGRSCLSAASSADPAKPEHRRLPVAKRRVADSGVAFSLLTFFWRSKRK